MAIEDSYDALLVEASRLRRGSLLLTEKIGNAHRLVFRGSDHDAVRRWIERERLHAGVLECQVAREPCGHFRVSVVPTTHCLAAVELLMELSGE